VKGRTILIYEENSDKTRDTLFHEFLDYAFSKIIEPYKGVANQLIKLVNEIAYQRKELFVESLIKLYEGIEQVNPRNTSKRQNI